MRKYVEANLMNNRKGICINFENFGLCIAILSKPRFTTLKKKIGNQEGYYIAIHRLMLGIGLEIKNKIGK
ncbi:UNVERIFIED_ORG: hypothetical protein B2H93_17345 [Clostridium botulinum]